MRAAFLRRSVLGLSMLMWGMGCEKDGAEKTPSASTDAKAGAPAAAADEHDMHAGHGAPGSAATKDGAADKKSVHFVFPHDGSKVFATFSVAMGATGITIVPAGTDIDDVTKGHHHIVVDGAPVAKGEVVPTDATHIHFGKAQTTAELTLSPGKHTLTLQLADGAHRSYGAELSSTITVNVVENPASTKVFFESPKDGATIKSESVIKFGIDGFSVRAAGEDVLDKTSGHHHLVIDGAAIDVGTMVPKDERNIHFGKGETETKLTLTPGKHTLTLQLADGAHLSYGPSVSSTISVTVE